MNKNKSNRREYLVAIGTTGLAAIAGCAQPPEYEPPPGVRTGNIIGEETTGDKKLDTFRISIRLQQHSDPVELTECQYKISTDSDTINIDGSPSTAGLNYTQDQQDPRVLEDNETKLTDSEDRIIAEFDLMEIDGETQLGTDESWTFSVEVPSGNTYSDEVTAPSRINEGSKYVI